MNWKPGDIAIIGDSSRIQLRYRYAIGAKCTLVRFVGYHPMPKHKEQIHDAWEIDIGGKQWFAAERLLRKPYDGHEPCDERRARHLWKALNWEPRVPVVEKTDG